MSAEVGYIISLVASLRGHVCPGCGRDKASHTTVCMDCFKALPYTIKTELYRSFGHGYEEAFAAAMRHLEVPESAIAARLPSAKDVILHRGCGGALRLLRNQPVHAGQVAPEPDPPPT